MNLGIFLLYAIGDFSNLMYCLKEVQFTDIIYTPIFFLSISINRHINDSQKAIIQYMLINLAPFVVDVIAEKI